MLGLWTQINPYVPRLTPDQGWRDWGKKSGPEVAFAGFWKLQSILATVCLLLLWHLIGWQTIPVMIGWALLATLVYELALWLGLKDLGNNPANTVPNIVVRVLSWELAFGWIALAYTRFHNWLRDHQTSSLASGLAVAVGLVVFGVIPSRQLLLEAGVEHKRHLLPISLLGRCANVPFHLLYAKSYLFILAAVWIESQGLRDALVFW